MTEATPSGIAALEAALAAAGLTQVELAERVSAISQQPLTPQGVHNWFARGVVPPSRCIPVEQALESLVTRFDLRPDVFGEPPTAPLDEASDLTLAPRSNEIHHSSAVVHGAHPRLAR